MTINITQRDRIINAILVGKANFEGSERNYARSLGISASAYSQLKSRKREGVVADAKLVVIGRKLQVPMYNAPEYNIVNIDVFDYLQEVFEACQEESKARMFCDIADCGKTVAATYYASKHKNVFYIDCSLVPTMRLFIKEIAKVIGLEADTTIHELVKNIGYMLQATDRPLIILDEAGDLSWEAFAKIKPLWNGTENCCGWVMIGADALAHKLERARHNKRVGAAETIRLFGREFMHCVPKGLGERTMFFIEQAERIIAANMPGATLASLNLIREKEKGKDKKDMPVLESLTRLKENIMKEKRLLAKKKTR